MLKGTFSPIAIKKATGLHEAQKNSYTQAIIDG